LFLSVSKENKGENIKTIILEIINQNSYISFQFQN
jgi:hypothetical protein